MELDSAASKYPPRPLPNTYWVVPGRLLAGEYPGARSALEASNRLQSLLHAGINTFIDLTAPGEIAPYSELLTEADVPSVYHRATITDHGVPETLEGMAQTLDLIDQLLAQGRCIYLHCRAGIGRTGLVVGCHLVRGGLAGDAALERLQGLWRQCERSRHWPSIPETDAQVRFVRGWREPSAGEPTLAQRCAGALVGLVIGNALGNAQDNAQANAQDGAAAEAGREVANGSAALPAGLDFALGADAAMTVAVAHSLLERGGHDPRDQMRRYQEWLQSSGAQQAPTELKRALASWKWSRKLVAGSHDPKNVDPHTLARTLAAALHNVNTPAAGIDQAVEISRTTLQSPVVLDLCRLWAAALLDTLLGAPKADVLSFASPLLQEVRARKLRPELEPLLTGDWGRVVGSGAQATVVAALSAWQQATSFEAGALLALGTARRRPTCGALYGAIAGASFGLEGIPRAWRECLPPEPALPALALRLANLAPSSAASS